MSDADSLLHVLSHKDVEQITKRLDRYRALLAGANLSDAEADAICADLTLELTPKERLQ